MSGHGGWSTAATERSSGMLDTRLGSPDGHQAGPALGHGGDRPGLAGAGGQPGADSLSGSRTGGRRGGAGPGEQRRTKRSKGRSWWIELPILLAFALVLALIIKTFVVQAFYIPSS